MAEVCALDPPLALAYELKGVFRAAVAMGKTGDVVAFTACLDLFDTWCRSSKLAPFKTLANSLRSWRAEILNSARSGGASNGFAESLNHLIKNQKRQSHGYATWAGTHSSPCFGEVFDPETGAILPLQRIPRGQGPRYPTTSFA